MVARLNPYFFKAFKKKILFYGIKCFEKANKQDSAGKLLKFSIINNIK